MSRKIEFRGKDIKGNWYYGLLTNDKNPNIKSDYEWFISNSKGKPYAYGVIESTIGQYTGFKDKNGNKIFEGDIVKVTSTNWWQGHKIEKVLYKKAVVSFHEKTQEIQFKEIGGRWHITMSTLFKSNEERHYLEVIGNIHEEA